MVEYIFDRKKGDVFESNKSRLWIYSHNTSLNIIYIDHND